MLHEATLCANEEVLLIDLEQVGRSPLVLKGLDNVLPAGLQINDGQQDLGFVVIGETEDG